MALAVMQACSPVWAQTEAIEPWPTAVLAPPGYTGAINTPTAHVLPWGAAAAGLTNSIPERARTIEAGSFGSLNLGVGLLPGLELVGRLVYEGDLNCNEFLPDCRAKPRDQSVSAKYQLPIELPLDTRLALGVTDYGGANSNFRQVYGVATSTWGPLDLSLGYSKPKSPTALLDGPFGSVALRIDERWSAALEHDSRAARLGVAWRQPLTPELALQLGASRKLGGDAPQQVWQLSAGLNVTLGRVPDPLRESREARAARQIAEARSLPEAAAPNATVAPATAATAESLAQALVANGFTQVQVRHWPAQAGQPALWQVQAEPRRWRQSQVDALGVALATWLKAQGQLADGSRPADELLLSLTWQREPVLHAYTSASCLDGWIQGWTVCADERQPALADSRALVMSRDLAGLGSRLAAIETRLQQAPAAHATSEGAPHWMPQFEIGPGLRNTVGTELGLYDYSLALELGAEVNLAPGLLWQGVLSAPLAHSDDYGPRGMFAGQRHKDVGLDSGLLTWWKPLGHGLAVQGSTGYVDRDYRGAMADAVWMNADGRWRLEATGGVFENDETGKRQTPLLGSARWSLVPGGWHLEATAGRFLGGDQGYSLASGHWFGDTRFKFYYRDSQGDAGEALAARRKFLGFEISLPLGPKAAADLGPVSLRGADRWRWGLQTKVGGDDNRLTYGYGMVPRARHGLHSDVSDHDRNGALDLLAQSPRLRETLQRALGAAR